MFYCEGCEMHHLFDERWSFNNDYDKPTFSPSLLVQYPWWNGEETENRRCHSFVKEGKIQYLNDCTHKLAGQTIELQNIDEI